MAKFSHLFLKESVTKPASDNGLAAAHKKAKEQSHDGAQHVRKNDTGHHYVSDWYSHDDTVASYSNGKLHESMTFVAPGLTPSKVPVIDTTKAGVLTITKADGVQAVYGTDAGVVPTETEVVKGDPVKLSEDMNLTEAEFKSLMAEKVEEYKSHQTTQTNRNFHTDKKSSDIISAMKDGDTKNVSIVHYSGGGLKLATVSAHRIKNSVHLHNSEGHHVDTIKHS